MKRTHMYAWFGAGQPAPRGFEQPARMDRTWPGLGRRLEGASLSETTRAVATAWAAGSTGVPCGVPTSGLLLHSDERLLLLLHMLTSEVLLLLLAELAPSPSLPPNPAPPPQPECMEAGNGRWPACHTFPTQDGLSTLPGPRPMSHRWQCSPGLSGAWARRRLAHLRVARAAAGVGGVCERTERRLDWTLPPDSSSRRLPSRYLSMLPALRVRSNPDPKSNEEVSVTSVWRLPRECSRSRRQASGDAGMKGRLGHTVRKVSLFSSRDRSSLMVWCGLGRGVRSSWRAEEWAEEVAASARGPGGSGAGRGGWGGEARAAGPSGRGMNGQSARDRSGDGGADWSGSMIRCDGGRRNLWDMATGRVGSLDACLGDTLQQALWAPPRMTPRHRYELMNSQRS